MTNRQNVIAALECRQGDYVPFWEMSFECWNTFSPPNIRGRGQSLVLGREMEALPAPEREEALQQNAEIFVSVAHELGFSMVRTPSGYWEVSPGELAYYVLPAECVFRQVELVRRLAGDDLVLVGNSGGIICMPGPTNYEEFCFALIEEPEKIEEMARQTLKRGLDNARRYRDAGADVAQTSSDLADNRGPFFSPPQMERLILPFLRQWAREIRALGMYAIIHTDGKLDSILDAIADSGVHGIQAIDSIAGMDMRETKDQVAGRCCLCGNIDPGLLLLGSPEQIFAKARNLLETCKPGGGVIFGSANAVFGQTPRENYLALVEAWRQHGRF